MKEGFSHLMLVYGLINNEPRTQAKATPLMKAHEFTVVKRVGYLIQVLRIILFSFNKTRRVLYGRMTESGLMRA